MRVPVDHAGRLLHVLTYCEGMGMSLKRYPHAAAVLSAHVQHLARLGPSAERVCRAALLAASLGDPPHQSSNGPAEQWGSHRAAYLALLDREEWIRAARAGLEAGDAQLLWLAEDLAGRLGLRAFDGRTPQRS
ncbi:hypothetical protein ACWGB8_08900 [Kitasatospora sp. NPDC054939]